MIAFRSVLSVLSVAAACVVGVIRGGVSVLSVLSVATTGVVRGGVARWFVLSVARVSASSAAPTSMSSAPRAVVALVALAGVMSVVDSGAQTFPSTPLWKKEISAKPVPVAPPVAAGDHLFLALESGISARRMSDGEELWLKKIVADGPMAAAVGYLVVQSQGELHVLSTETGNEIWGTKPGKMTAPPLVHEQWLFVAAEEHLIAYQVADGAERWRRDLGVVEERPAFEGAQMYVPVADGQLVALIVESGKDVWRVEVGIKPTEPMIYADRIFIGSAAKHFSCLKMVDGKEEWNVEVGARVVGRAAADVKNVYVVALDNLLRAHDRKNGALRWYKDLTYRPTAGPTLAGKSVSAPGMFPILKSFDPITGKPSGQLVLTDKLAVVPVFIETPRGPNIAALTGNLNNVWTLTLAVPAPFTPPVMTVQPLSALPGVSTVRPGTLTVPRG
jgi:outer membrane protein assembly factor BamB